RGGGQSVGGDLLRAGLPDQPRDHRDLPADRAPEGGVVMVFRRQARRSGRRVVSAALAALDDFGDQLSLYGRAIGWTPRALRRDRKEIARLLAGVSFGAGALIVILGPAGVMAALSLFVGSLVGLQGFRALDSLGTQALTGFVTAYFNTRDIAPLVASQALVCTLGAGYTAEL